MEIHWVLCYPRRLDKFSISFLCSTFSLSSFQISFQRLFIVAWFFLLLLLLPSYSVEWNKKKTHALFFIPDIQGNLSRGDVGTMCGSIFHNQVFDRINELAKWKSRIQTIIKRWFSCLCIKLDIRELLLPVYIISCFCLTSTNTLYISVHNRTLRVVEGKKHTAT